MIEAAIAAINERFPLTRRDAGAYAAFPAKPLTITLDWYEADGLGNVSALRGKAMGGLMRMDTLVVNATQRDVPLFSFDSIAAMGRRTMLIEYYDTLLDPAACDTDALNAVKQSVAALPDYDLGAHWYDSIKLPASFAKKTGKAALPALGRACSDALAAYLTLAQETPALPDGARALKRAKAKAYVDGLLENGGPSTDAFCKALGREKTAELFSRIIFGTQE